MINDKKLSSTLKLADLAIFIAVVEQGSFTKAADYCELPKSTVSRHVRELENSLGVRLLERNTRSLNLTYAGEQLLGRAKALLDDVEDIECEIGKKGVPQGKVTLYTPVVLTALCADKVAEFCQKFPDIRLDMRSTAPGQSLGIDTRFDLLLFVGQLPDSSFIAHPLAEMTLDYYATPQYIEQHGLPQTPQDIAKHSLVFRPIHDDEPEQWCFGECSVNIKPNIRVDSPYLSRALIMRGVGIGRMPKFMIGDDLHHGRIISLFDGKYAFKETVYGVYPSRRHVPDSIKVLIEFIRKELPKQIAVLESGDIAPDW